MLQTDLLGTEVAVAAPAVVEAHVELALLLIAVAVDSADSVDLEWKTSQGALLLNLAEQIKDPWRRQCLRSDAVGAETLISSLVKSSALLQKTMKMAAMQR